jgi:hypothetical protein
MKPQKEKKPVAAITGPDACSFSQKRKSATGRYHAPDSVQGDSLGNCVSLAEMLPKVWEEIEAIYLPKRNRGKR